MRIFTACFGTETNTFAPFPTGLAGFQEYGISRNASQNEDVPFAGPLRVFRRLADGEGDEIVESLSTFAQPSGITVRSTYERLRDEILGDLAQAGAIDIILLMMHGAMVAEGYDDCEGDILARVRAIAPNAVIGVELDLHCHMTEAMVQGADVIILCKEYPHIDFGERAKELFTLCRRTAQGEIAPVAALVDTRMIGFYPTFDPPMSEIVQELRRTEVRPGILSASLAHGFPWGDVADAGTRVLVYADGDPDVAAAAATGVARQLYDLREELLPKYPELSVSLSRARELNGRVLLADFADNPGGGGPGDSTFFLSAMLEHGMTDAVIGCFWDPLVASVCAAAGVGAKLDVRLGGKCGPASGTPLDLSIEVMGVRENHDQGRFGQRQQMGLSAWIRCKGIDIAVCSIRTQVFDPDAFTGLGINLDGKRLVVVKSSAHYQAGFRGHADHQWQVRTPGVMPIDFAAIPYRKRARDFYPAIADPWAESGEPKAKIFRQPHRSRGAG